MLKQISVAPCLKFGKHFNNYERGQQLGYFSPNVCNQEVEH